MPDTSYPPPNVLPPPVNEPSIAARSNPALIAAASGAILHHESGSTPTHLNNPTSYAGAVGPGQIMPGTFKQYALPGENINNPADNLRVHDRIMADYAQRWPNDPARWAVAYQSGPGNVAPPGSPTPWKRNIGDGNNTVAQYVANTAGKLGSYKEGSSAAAPSPQPAQPPPPTTVGGALGWLTAANAQTGKSPLQDAAGDAGKAMGGDQQQQAPPQADQQLGAQQAAAAGGNARQQQVAQQAQQMAATIAQRAAAPVSWNSLPPGARGGLQNPPMTTQMWGGLPVPVPGTTLNSTGAGYGVG